MVKRDALAGLLAAATALVIAATAVAAGPVHNREAFTDVDTNFCGTGATVEIEGTFMENIWVTGDEARGNVHFRITFTNPVTGASAVEHWSFNFSNTIVSGMPEGLHTHEFNERGLKATFKLANGRLLTRDAGNLLYRLTFDGETFVSFELVSMRGPHPGFLAEEDWFCATLVPALGLE